jgi:hypothetical protein
VQALVSGKVDCVIIDNEPAKAFVAANNTSKRLSQNSLLEGTDIRPLFNRFFNRWRDWFAGMV